MKTCGDIEKQLENETATLKRIKERGGFNPFLEGVVETLEWVLDVGEEEVISEDEWWNRLVEMAKNSPPVSRDELIQHFKEALESPNPFFKYLKEKSNENKS